MAHLIDKDTLLAEIDRQEIGYNTDGKHSVEYDTTRKILNIINTLEVKEDNLLTEKKIEKELAEDYINIFDKKFGNKLPKLKSKQLAEFKNFINTCEQTFHMKYFDYHATQGKLFEKLALLWAVWGKEHLTIEIKEVDLEKETEMQERKDIENAFKAGYELGYEHGKKKFKD